MTGTARYGNPEKMTVVKQRMSDSSRVSITETITIGVVIVLVLAVIAAPFIYYVATVVPAQQERMHELRIECLAHHTVESCMRLTNGNTEPLS